MITKILSVLILLLAFNCKLPAQSNDNDILFNLTISASNPAFNILDLSPSVIERPRDPNDFTLLLQQATENFSVIPKNYAIEISSWIFKPAENFTEFKSNRVADNLKQNTVFSAATTTIERNDSVIGKTRLGLGLKFSLLRGDITGEIISLSRNLDNLKKIQSGLVSGYLEIRDKIEKRFQEEDTEYQKLLMKMKELRIQIRNDTSGEVIENLMKQIEKLDTEINNRKKLISDEAEKEVRKLKNTDIKDLEKEIANIEFVRRGLKLDLSFALAYDFKEQNFNNGKISKIGAWVTFGGDFNVKKNSSTTFLTILKLLNTPDTNYTVNCNCGNTIFKNSLTNFDFGARLIQSWSKFSLSGEVIFRTESNQKPKNKYLMDFGYNAGENKMIIFSFGKEFEGSPYKKGDLIAALNFILGLGSERPF